MPNKCTTVNDQHDPMTTKRCASTHTQAVSFKSSTPAKRAQCKHKCAFPRNAHVQLLKRSHALQGTASNRGEAGVAVQSQAGEPGQAHEPLCRQGREKVVMQVQGL